MEFLQEYIVAVVLGICLCVGFILKNLIGNKTLNQFIPAIVAVLGVLINTWVSGWSFTPSVLLGGLISGLASTGMYEMLRNFIDKATKKEG